MKRSLIISFMIFAALLPVGTRPTVTAQLLDFDNTRVNSDAGTAAQYNGVVAINPRNPDNAVIVWQDMRSGYPRVAIGYTINGGRGWSDYLLDPQAYTFLSDPTIAADTDGNFFACMLAGDTSGQSPNDIIVMRSSDGGASWSGPMVAVAGSPGIHDITPSISVDNTPFSSNGFVYVAWVRYADDISSSFVYSTQSSDHGLTFLEQVQVSDVPGVVRWPNIGIRTAFGNGDVDVCWFRSHYPGILFDHSVTEGWTFGHDYWPVVTGADNNEINGGIIVSTAPVMAGDNQSGSSGYEKAYLVYMDSSNSNWSIFCSMITSFFNNAEYIDFWPPVLVNDDIGDADQFMPAVAVDKQGTIHVAFLDRRLDSGNLLYDVFYTSSTDFGSTWTPNVRVSNVSSNPAQPGVAGRIGNRIGIAAWESRVYIAWTDARNGNTDVFVSRLLETGISEEPAPLPGDISMDNLYPNPFNGRVEIRYSSGAARRVNLDVIDLGGRFVAGLFNGDCRPGANSLVWDGRGRDGRDVSSGIYFVRLNAGGRTLMKKAVLLR